MLSIHTNHNAMHAYRYLLNNSRAMGKSIEKLSSGYRINSAADGPADLIISEKLRSQIEGLERAIQNTTETKNLLSITEGALGEVQNILRNMNKLAVGAANSGIVNADQIAADQAQMDAALQAIDRILGTTSYAGRKPLDNINLGGGQGSTPSKPSSQAANVVATPESYAKEGKPGLVDAGIVSGRENAQQVDENGLVANGDKTFSILGSDPEAAPLGAFTFAEGTDVGDIVAALKAFAIPAAEAVSPDPNYAPPDGRVGGDINAVALDIPALAHLQGLPDEAAANFLAAYMENFTPDGSLVATLGEPGTPLQLGKLDQELYDFSTNLMNMNSGGLGGVQVTKRYSADGVEETRTLYLADLYGGGAASLAADPEAAMKIIRQAIKDVAGMRAEIGAIQANRLQADENAMRTELENLTRSESAIRDTDFASEMIEFTRTQVFSQVGTKMLAAANEQGQHILDLIA